MDFLLQNYMEAPSINTLNNQKKKIFNIFIRLVRKNYWIFLFFAFELGMPP